MPTRLTLRAMIRTKILDYCGVSDTKIETENAHFVRIRNEYRALTAPSVYQIDTALPSYDHPDAYGRWEDQPVIIYHACKQKKLPVLSWITSKFNQAAKLNNCTGDNGWRKDLRCSALSDAAMWCPERKAAKSVANVPNVEIPEVRAAFHRTKD